MAMLEANGVQLHHQRYGEGEDVVMLHGLAANLAFWHRRIIPMLAGDFRITVMDLRGHGLSGIPAAGYTVGDFAGDLHAVIDGTGLDKVHLVGHSMGGAVCLMYAILHPERVKTLTLVDARVHAVQPLRMPDDGTYWASRREEMRKMGIDVPDDTPKVVYKMLEELDPLVKSGLVNDNTIFGLLVSGRGWNPKSRSAKRWNELVSTTSFKRDILEVSGLTEQGIAGLTHPSLLTYGADSFCMETCRGLERLLPDSRTVIHPGMGHFYPAVAPELFVNDFIKFMAACAVKKDAMELAVRKELHL